MKIDATINFTYLVRILSNAAQRDTNVSLRRVDSKQIAHQILRKLFDIIFISEYRALLQNDINVV